MKRYYFDYAATTPLLPEVKTQMVDVMDRIYGNPSSVHFHGRTAKTEVENARKQVATLLNTSLSEIFFTSGATESNNTVLYKAVNDLDIKTIISSPTEHHCITHTLAHLNKTKQINHVNLNVDSKGNINYQQLEELLQGSNSKTLVCLMHANNELGTMHDIERIGNLCKKYKALFSCDAAQTYGKVPIDLQQLNIDFLAIASHKIYGPKGVGVLYINDDINISPLFFGGSQERNMRAGTENIIGISGFAKATELARMEMQDRDKKIHALRQSLLSQLSSEIPDLIINGNVEELYLPNIINFWLPRTKKTDMLIFNLDIAGISASAGSACSSGVEQKSHVIAAIAPEFEGNNLRISLSHLHTEEDIRYLCDTLKSFCST